MSDFSVESINILKDIIGVCFSEDKIDQWREFLIEKECDFKNNESEYSHFQYQVYRDFIEMIEVSLQEKCERNRLTLDEFFELCQSFDNIPAVNVFNTVIVLTTSPETFFDIMKDSNKREYMFGVILSWRKYFLPKK